MSLQRKVADFDHISLYILYKHRIIDAGMSIARPCIREYAKEWKMRIKSHFPFFGSFSHFITQDIITFLS